MGTFVIGPNLSLNNACNINFDRHKMCQLNLDQKAFNPRKVNGFSKYKVLFHWNTAVFQGFADIRSWSLLVF